MVATEKLSAIRRKKNPITSSHNWCNARPNDRAVVRTPFMTALRVRLRPACRPATCATTPNFRKVETLLTASILTASGATMTQRSGAATGEPFRLRRHPIACKLVILSRGTRWIHNSSNS